MLIVVLLLVGWPHRFVVAVCALNVVQQGLVGQDWLLVHLLLQVFRIQRQFAHSRNLRISALATFPVGEHAAAQVGVELLLVDDMALEVYDPRVALLLARLLHQRRLFHAPGHGFRLPFLLLGLAEVTATFLVLLGLYGLLLLGLLDLSQLDLAEHLVFVLLGSPAGHALFKSVLLTLLLFLKHGVHGVEFLVMAVKQTVHVLLTHFSQEFALLFGQLLGHQLFLLPAELLQLLALVVLFLLLPREEAVLSVLKLLGLLRPGFLQLSDAPRLFAVLLATEDLEFLIGIAELLIEVLAHLVVLGHVAHQ